jgi:hypothetical protein
LCAIKKALARKGELLLSLLMLSLATQTMMKLKRRIAYKRKRMIKERRGRSLMDVRKGRGRKWYIQTARLGWWSK